MKSGLIILLALAASLVSLADAQGAGRAFPVASENFAITQFQSVNRRIKWDPTNFLIDLAGKYANCDSVSRSGTLHINQNTPDGNSIRGYFDNGAGSAADVNAVNQYIQGMLKTWTSRNPAVQEMIRNALVFGCSVRPSCGSSFVVACLFSPGTLGEDPDTLRTPSPSRCDTACTKEYNPVCGTDGVTYGNPCQLGVAICRSGNRISKASDGECRSTGGGTLARAFTNEQYVIAEGITGMRWDRSHLLENLSGLETKCGMVGQTQWLFSNKPLEYDVTARGIFDYSENKGSTGDALEIILRKLKPKIHSGKQIGCSVIPDCITGGKMYVVVSCLYKT